MRITENQIRRIIRQSLRESLLLERRATNWNEYVEITTDKGIDNAEQLKDLYQGLFKEPGWDETNKWLSNYGAVDGQTDAYDDYVDWYLRINDMPQFAEIKGSQRYLSPDHVLEILESFKEVAEEEPDSPPEEVAKAIEIKLSRRAIRSQKKSDKSQAKANFQAMKSLLQTLRKNDMIDQKEYKEDLAYWREEFKKQKHDAREYKREELDKLRTQRRETRRSRRKDRRSGKEE